MTQHLTAIGNLSTPDIIQILDRANYFASAAEYPATLKGKCILALFAENSTRTRMSFEMAVKRLGGEFLLMTADGSSLKKGESDLDNILTLNALMPDGFIVRHGQNGFADFAASHMDCPVLNAGDGTNEHPTQALLDALTLRQAFGDLKDKSIVICGDTKHSRVAHSNALCLKRLGADVTFVSPDTLMDNTSDVSRSTDFNSALKTADAVMMLRVQKERFNGADDLDYDDYIARYQLNDDRLAHLSDHTIILHPGPMNRGIEITDAAADHPRSLVLKQVENGVYTRMACLEYVLNLKGASA